MEVDEFIKDLEEYFGDYRNAHQKDITRQYIFKMFDKSEYQKLKKYIFETQHANYGPPLVSAIKRATKVAYTDDMYSFKRPRNTSGSHPMRKCEFCGKILTIDSMMCGYCQKPVKYGLISFPPGY